MSKQSVSDERGPLDSTQTLRAISLSELQDPNQRKWFAIQLATSDRPVNLETMPQLDVFAAYRLYVVVGRYGTVTRYGLRLGFFGNEVSANTICGYLRTFFPSPTIVRVSAAEQARFTQGSPPTASSKMSSDVRAKPTPRTAAIALVEKAPVARVMAQKPVSAVKQPAQKAAGSSQKLFSRTKSLAQELLEEARQVQLSRTSKKRVPEHAGSWLSRLLGGTKG